MSNGTADKAIADWAGRGFTIPARGSELRQLTLTTRSMWICLTCTEEGPCRQPAAGMTAAQHAQKTGHVTQTVTVDTFTPRDQS